MNFHVKELFTTLQGEGVHAGRRAVFCRFAFCNLWTGREQDRAAAVCRFCDTQFVGPDGVNGGRYTAAALAAKCSELWGPDRARRYVVLTGGEPTLQVDSDLLEALHGSDFEVAIETNGTRPVPAGVDWITVSPKAGAEIVQTRGDELKLVYPQPGAAPERFEGLSFKHFLLQPMWVAGTTERAAHVQAAAEYCLARPQWRLSLQQHKIVGLP